MKASKNKKENKKLLKSSVNEKGLHSVVDKLLKQDKRLWTTEGKLIENKLIEFVQKDDENIIKLLLSDPLTKDAFFQKISSIFVFKKDDFINFETMSEFLDGSYTTYTKHIGLANNFSLLKNASEVVLNFPYKDCVLEGGQEKIDEERDEIFYNKILAREEINRLEEEKVLTDWVKYTEKGKQKITSFDHNKDNLILKGNNLLALYSLLPKFRGKVKLIYIDPPYNTGTDDFKYNDNFNHSSWLVFMKNRLEIAKKLLKEDGVIFVQCDDNEQAYLKVLMDEVFNDLFINCIAVKMNESKGLKNAHVDKRFPKNKEYLLVYAKDINLFRLIPKKIEKEPEELDKYIRYYGKWIPNLEDDISKWKIENFPKENNIEEKLKYKDRLIYLVKPDNEIRAEIAEGKFIKIKNRRDIENIYYKKNGVIFNVLFLEDNIVRFLGDLWTDISTININKEGGEKTLSNGQKPERLIHRIIDMTTKTGDLVLDYHLGSGTTCAVAHKMGRRYIGIEQMDYIENITLERLKNVIEGESGGISEIVNWGGGGSFVYAELVEWNKKYIEEIKKAKTTKDLIKIYEKMSKESFFVYTFDQSKWDNKKFEELTIDSQKKILCELLNMNHLYVNYKDIEDTTFKISQEDIKINKNFYE